MKKPGSIPGKETEDAKSMGAVNAYKLKEGARKLHQGVTGTGKAPVNKTSSLVVDGAGCQALHFFLSFLFMGVPASDPGCDCPDRLHHLASFAVHCGHAAKFGPRNLSRSVNVSASWKLASRQLLSFSLSFPLCCYNMNMVDRAVTCWSRE